MAAGELILRRVSEVSQNHLDSLNCGNGSLEEFLREQAVEYDRVGLTTTTLVYAEDGGEFPVAYFSLSSDSLKLSVMEVLDLGLNFDVPVRAFPAIKITRLAVATAHQSRGVGGQLLELIEGIAFTLPAATRLLTVDADNSQRTIDFYKKHGFEESMENLRNRQNELRQRKDDAPAITISMWKDIYAEG